MGLIFHVIQVILDISQDRTIAKQTHDLVLKHIFFYFHIVSIRKFETETEGKLFERAFVSSSMIIGYISEFAYTDIMRHVCSTLDPQRKYNPEEVILTLTGCRYCFAVVVCSDIGQM